MKAARSCWLTCGPPIGCTFVDEMMTIPNNAGLPYPVRDYLAILPIHWLTDPKHVERMACGIYDDYGVTMGTRTDATTEVIVYVRIL